MTWGRGYGVPWGGGPLVPPSAPLAEVGGEPTSFVFTDEPDGPLPGSWEFYQLTDDGLGGITGAAEPDPNAYYRVSSGLGLWAYRRTPLSGTPALEQGVAASPSGTLEGRDARASAIFRSPLVLKARSVDLFRFEVVVGLRLQDAGTTFIGGRVRAEWDAGTGWTVPIAVEAVTAAEGPISVIASAPLPDLPDLTDLWAVIENHELEVEVRGSSLTVRMGTLNVTVTVPDDGPAKALLLSRIFNRVGTTVTPAPAFLGFAVQSLRDLERLGPAPQIEGDGSVYEHHQLPKQSILGADLADNSKFKRLGARQFQSKQDQTTSVGNTEYRWNQGDIIRTTERFVGQYLVGIVPDLAAIRGRRE